MHLVSQYFDYFEITSWPCCKASAWRCALSGSLCLRLRAVISRNIKSPTDASVRNIFSARVTQKGVSALPFLFIPHGALTDSHTQSLTADVS